MAKITQNPDIDPNEEVDAEDQVVAPEDELEDLLEDSDEEEEF